jgi:hypothetical protein
MELQCFIQPDLSFIQAGLRVTIMIRAKYHCFQMAVRSYSASQLQHNRSFRLGLVRSSVTLRSV